MVVDFKNGESLSIALSEKPQASFEENSLVLRAENFESTYVVTDVKRFRFEEQADGIATLQAAGQLTSATVFTLDGRQVATCQGCISLSALPAGRYVVKTANGKSFKMVKR